MNDISRCAMAAISGEKPRPRALGSTIIDDADRKLIIHCSRPAGTDGMERVSEITEITISTVGRCSYAASRRQPRLRAGKKTNPDEGRILAGRN